MFILEASMCENASFLSTVYYIKNIIFIISIMIPIVLVVLLTLDLARAVVAGDENRMKEAQNHAIKRILYSVIIIVVPIVVNAVFTTLGKGGVDGLDCYNNATKEKIVKLIESCVDGNIRIWNFHSGLFLQKIKVSDKPIFDFCEEYNVSPVCLLLMGLRTYFQKMNGLNGTFR